MAKKKNDAEKCNMALSMHYLHGLSNKQITRITGLHYKTVESYLTKLEAQLASGELSADDIMASAESANRRLGIEALIAEDGGKRTEEKSHDELLKELDNRSPEWNKMVKEKAKKMNNIISEQVGIPVEAIFGDDTFTELVTTEPTPYPIVVLQDLIERINSKSIAITCLSISEDDYGMLSLNWRPTNESR